MKIKKKYSFLKICKIYIYIYIYLFIYFYFILVIMVSLLEVRVKFYFKSNIVFFCLMNAYLRAFSHICYFYDNFI